MGHHNMETDEMIATTLFGTARMHKPMDKAIQGLWKSVFGRYPGFMYNYP